MSRRASAALLSLALQLHLNLLAGDFVCARHHEHAGADATSLAASAPSVVAPTPPLAPAVSQPADGAPDDGHHHPAAPTADPAADHAMAPAGSANSSPSSPDDGPPLPHPGARE